MVNPDLISEPEICPHLSRPRPLGRVGVLGVLQDLGDRGENFPGERGITSSPGGRSRLEQRSYEEQHHYFYRFR